MTSFQTFETTGTVDENGVLQVAPFVGVPAGQVVVSVKVPKNEALDYDDSDLSPEQWNAGLTRLMAPHFSDDPAEDIYTREDGKPYDGTQD